MKQKSKFVTTMGRLWNKWLMPALFAVILFYVFVWRMIFRNMNTIGKVMSGISC